MADDRSAADNLASLARSDLARRLGVSVDDVKVLAIEAKQWPDAGLGCPEPGKVYAAVITPGYRITLRAGGSRYEYRSDRRRVRLCSGDQHG